MSIDKNDINKYIFDPDNPKECKSYNLLVNIAKKDFGISFSPNFLHYLLRNKLFTKEFEQEIWDRPDNYHSLNPIQKMEIAHKKLTHEDIKYFLTKHIDFSRDKFFNNGFFKNILVYCVETTEKTIMEDKSILDKEIEEDIPTSNVILPISMKKSKKTIKTYKTIKERKKVLNTSEFFDLILKKDYLGESEYLDIWYDKIKFNNIYDDLSRMDKVFFKYKKNLHYKSNKPIVIFSVEELEYLNIDIKRSSIFVTLIDNKDKFFKYNQNIFKPLFLKKIEDVDLLLTILENDLEQKSLKNIKKEISYISKVSIENFFSIKKMNIDFDNKKEIYIVGENGDGKTLLLQALAVGLKGTVEDGLEEFRKKEDEYHIDIDNSGLIKNNFFAYGALRNNACQLDEDKSGYLTLFSGAYDLKNPIKWLITLDHYEKKGDMSIVISVNKAKELFNELLNSDIDLEITPENVIFKEKGSEVSFERLSEGYKGVIRIVCDLISRLSKKQKVGNLKDYRGVVLIDEVELHLHPKWQYDFVKKLRTIFPLIQFIVTTHSPSVILGASKDAVFYKIYKEDGAIKLSKPIDNIKNLMANNLSTSPLFDMATARARNSDENIDTSDDFIYTKIHEKIAQRVKNKKNIVSEDIEKMIDKELDKILNEIK